MKSTNLQKVRIKIGQSASLAREWFESETEKITRDEYKNKGGLGDKKTGSVYVYYKQINEVLYVGETGGGVKERTHFPTARHITTDWWDQWKYLRFLPISNQTDRLILELLLILAYKPRYNKKPGTRPIEKLFEN